MCLRDSQGQVYLRFGRLAVPVINAHPNYEFEIGKAITLRDGSDVAIIAAGLEVNEALVAAERLAEDGIQAEVINMHTIKPLDSEAVLKACLLYTSGKREVLGVELQEEVVDPEDIEMLQDLVVAAVNEALRQVDEANSSVMNKLTGGIGGGMPGLF